jgi:8-oxo-dGTP pyrophosphatase MutT (NUDIX family)
VAHIKIRIGVYGICIRDKKVLMVKTQSGTKTIYNFPGGGVDNNEEFIDALERECIEELGCITTVQQMICTSDRLYKHPDFDDNGFHLYYAITIDSTIDSSIQEAQWFPIDKLPLDMMLEVDKAIIKFLG